MAENSFRALSRCGLSQGYRIDWAESIDRPALLARLDVDIEVTRLTSSYSGRGAQLVAIARALGLSSRVLSSMSDVELDDDDVKSIFACAFARGRAWPPSYAS